MGLRAASALISIRGGHWPRLAHLPRDWLRGRQPGLIFLRRGPRPGRSCRLPGRGRGRAEAREAGAGLPTPLPRPPPPSWPRRGSLLSDWLLADLSERDRALSTKPVPRWPGRGKGGGSAPLQGPTFPPAPLGALRRGSPHGHRRLRGPFLLRQVGPQRIVGSSQLGASAHRGLSVPAAAGPSPGPWGRPGLSCLWRDKATFSCVPRSPSADRLSPAPEVPAPASASGWLAGSPCPLPQSPQTSPCPPHLPPRVLTRHRLLSRQTAHPQG